MSRELQGPVLGRRRLSVTLRHARDNNGFTQEQVAAAMDWSLSKLIRIEKGAVGISTTDLKSLLQHYGIDDPDQISDLVRLAKSARERPWWAPFREQLPSADFEKLLGLEAEASRIEMFQPSVIPGLLQTEPYVDWILRGIAGTLTSPEAAHVRADVRLRRQQAVLESDDPPQLHVLLDEATLRRIAHGRRVMREQLLHLAELSRRPNVTVEVIPFSAGPYVESGAFAILSFAGPADPSVVYLENAWYDSLIDGTEQVTQYEHLFALLRKRALDSAQSEKLIRTVADEFR